MSQFSAFLFGFVVLISTVTFAAGLPPITDICKSVETRLPGRISYPGNQSYSDSVSSYYVDQERELSPRCVFRPTTTSEVSQFIKLVAAQRKNDKSKGPIPKFAIRGGGHSLVTGAANIDAGVTVDMRTLKSFALSKDKKTASVGGGAIWSDIYPQLTPHQLTVMGGRIPGIAVGGFTTGGGVSFLARKHGWACDNIYGYEVVLANGDVVYASARSNTDLWLALKGGSNNFGVITRFDLATFPQGPMWGGAIQFNYSKSVLEAQAKAFDEYLQPKNFDESAEMGMIVVFQNPGRKFGVLNSLFYAKPTPNPAVYKSFLSIPSITPNTLAIANVSDLVVNFGATLPPNLPRAIEMVYSFKHSDAALYTELFKLWEDGIKPIADIEGLGVQFLIQAHPVTNGTNSLGLTPGKKDEVMAVVTTSYPNAKDDRIVQKGLENIIRTHESLLRKRGLYLPFKYLNYADKIQDPIASYGPKSKTKLQAVSKKYDPSGLFQQGVPGGFKLFR